MTSRSMQIRLEEVIPGMVLSDDLRDHQGHILLAQGVTLTTATVNALRRHDIETLPVLCEALPAEDEAVLAQQHLRRLARLFRKHDENDEGAAMIRQYMTRYRLEGGHDSH